MIILKMLFRNAFRNKLRALLTILGIAIAILAFGLLRTVISAWYAGVNASSAYRLVTRNAISIIFPIPISFKEKIRQINHVKLVSYGNWFGGIYIEEKNFFPNFAIDAATYLDLYPEFILSEQDRKAFFGDRKGCAVGKKLASKFRWKIGDIITLKAPIYSGEWDFIIRGIYKGRDKTIDETQFFFHWEYLNETLKKKFPNAANQVGFYLIGISAPEFTTDVAIAIDDTFKNSQAETLTETEKAFQLGFVSMSSAIVTTIQLVSIVIIIIIMGVVANTMSMTTRERIGDYVILKTLGFDARHISILIFGESFVICYLGNVIGIMMTFPAVKTIAENLANFFPVFNIETNTLILDFVCASIVAVVASVVPIIHAIRVNIAEGLRQC